MCTNKKLIKNKKYSMNKKNGGIIPPLRDPRQAQVYVPCGKCYICKKKKAREWKLRITEDIKVNKKCKIVTLTFNTKSLRELAKDCKGLQGYELDNGICKIAVKRFRERWRKKYGRSIRHWLITELGHGKTEHVHMHGIVWEDDRYKLEDTLINEVEKIWQYGFVGKGKYDYKTGLYENYVNAKTANYFTKYVNKKDEAHPNYTQIILTSAGIGASYLKSEKAKDNVYKEDKTNQLYYEDNGKVLPLPEYFRRKLYTEEEREALTTFNLNSGKEYIEGKEYKNISDTEREKIMIELRKKNGRLGYHIDNRDISKKIHELNKRKKIHEDRIGKIEKGETKYWDILDEKMKIYEEEELHMDMLNEELKRSFKKN